MQTSGKRACSYFPEYSLSFTKIMQGESNGMTVRLSLISQDIAEPKLILYKDSPKPRIVSVPDSENIRRTLFF